jgi:tetratricopeptide (TPR) repeat protein
VLARSPQRLPALEGLARIRERQGNEPQARALLERIVALKRAPESELLKLGELAMRAGDTPAALGAFERARALQGDRFSHSLELGVLYLAARRYEEARDALDRVPPGHPGGAMALFKRAQVSVLLGEDDRAERVRRARAGADATTRPLIEREKLFRDIEAN